MRRELARWAIVGAACLAMGACEPEERVISQHGLLTGLPGAESRTPTTAPRASANVGAPIEHRIRIEHEDGSVTLIANSAKDVLIHVVATLKDEEEELFVEQVLSEKTKQEFYDRGYDPVWAYRELKRRERDVRRLYSAMPFGEFTPGLRLQPLGRNEFRVKVPPGKDLPWSFLDVIIEHGQWKLRWFGPS